MVSRSCYCQCWYDFPANVTVSTTHTIFFLTSSEAHSLFFCSRNFYSAVIWVGATPFCPTAWSCNPTFVSVHIPAYVCLCVCTCVCAHVCVSFCGTQRAFPATPLLLSWMTTAGSGCSERLQSPHRGSQGQGYISESTPAALLALGHTPVTKTGTGMTKSPEGGHHLGASRGACPPVPDARNLLR